MPNPHVTRELLWQVARGEVEARQLVALVERHLQDLCPDCHREIVAWGRERTGVEAYDDACERVHGVLADETATAEQELRRAEEAAAELLALAPGERIEHVRSSPDRYSGAVLAERLLTESRERMTEDPAEAYGLARMAQTVLEGTCGWEDNGDPWLLSLALMANARRAEGALVEADELFRQLRGILRQTGVTDPLAGAEIDSLEGSLRKDQRRFAEAEALLRRAALCCRLLDETPATARILLKLASVHGEAGEPERAAEAARSALEILPPDEEPRLHLMARHNLAHALCDAGRHRAARCELQAARELYRRFPEPWAQLRHRWLEGKIALGIGETATAEQVLTEARQGFVERGVAFDAALVSFDLALLYAEQGRSTEIRRLAEEMLPIFDTLNVHRETLAALILFREAARQETVTTSLVRRLAEVVAVTGRYRGALVPS